MDTRSKLEEAKYFLDALVKTKDDPKLLYFNLSAFLSAWRSVLDVMLYDFAEHYSIGFTRQDVITDQNFKAVAQALKHRDALHFIDWWRKKQGKLKENPLWGKRILIVHRGYPTISSTHTFYVSGSGGTSITTTQPPPHWIFPATSEPVELVSGEVISPEIISPTTQQPSSEIEVRFSDFPNIEVTDMCTQAFHEMEKIVQQAQAIFHVRL